jgi:serine/threonine-protein kinase
MRTIFNNRYRIEARIGNGGMAIVYSGTDTLLRRRVAIKVLREQYAADADFVTRFSYEAQAAAKLSHPNIVNVYDFGTEDDAQYLVMELVDGETLAEQIASERVIPEPVAIDYAIQIASGLAYAHRQGLLHRDIKPANILITKDDVVKISDFGIARAVSEQSLGVTQPGMVMGSVSYLAPEQAQARATDERSDLYSAGVVLYQMLTGELPFTGDSPVAVALKHVQEPMPPIDTATTGISPALAAIVERLLQKDPNDRFSSASELATALREARERPSEAMYVRRDDPTRPIDRIPTPPPRRSAAPDRPVEVRVASAPARAGRIAALVMLLLVAIAAGYLLIVRSPFGPARTIAVGDYTGQSSSQAQQAVIFLGLKPSVTEVTSGDVPPDRIVRQDPPPGSKLARDESVQLFVSSGAPLVDVPDVKGYTRTDAERLLAGAKFRTKIVERFANEPKDTVIDVNPNVGEKAREGSTIALTVSQGQAPITVPNVVSMTVDKARDVLAKAELSLDIVQKTPSDTIPENTVASQDPKDGSPAAKGSTVAVVVSTGAGDATVPDVGGKSPADAAAALQAAGFDAQISYNVDPSNAGGNVTAQQPLANTQARRGSKVTILISVPGTVPDVSGLGLDDAKKAIETSGYAVGNIATTSDGAEGKVVRTEPEANSPLRPGESVVIYYHPPAIH